MSEPFTWEKIKQIVGENRLELFTRTRQQMDSYIQFKKMLNDENISINDFIKKYELEWDDSTNQTCSTKLFQGGVKILLNKFPYNFPNNITHLVIWSKIDIPSDPTSPKGDISPKTRSIIDKYVAKTFSSYDVVWFRNWSNLQSVKALSHIHVLVKDMPDVHKVLGTNGCLLEDGDYVD